MTTRLTATAAALALVSFGALAQNATDNTVQRDINQQNRIERGLENGRLTTREAGLLEKEEARIARLQARDLKDGRLSAAERAQLRAAQDKASRDIALAKHNGVDADPLSGSSQRMQADVQRNINQQQRIESGLQSGALTHREAAGLERGQARVDHREQLAARDGHVGALEQQRVQRSENRQSRHIFREKHDARRGAAS